MATYVARHQKKPYNTGDEDGGLFDIPDDAIEVFAYYTESHAVVRWLEPVEEEPEPEYYVVNPTGTLRLWGPFEDEQWAEDIASTMNKQRPRGYTYEVEEVPVEDEEPEVEYYVENTVTGAAMGGPYDDLETAKQRSTYLNRCASHALDNYGVKKVAKP